MTRIPALIASALLVVLLAVPAAAQEPDFYGGELPGNVTQPGDVTVPPDPSAAPAPGGASSVGPVSGADNTVRATGGGVAVFGRQLAVTGGELTVVLLVVGAGLLAAGTAAVTVARRRSQQSA